MRFWPSASCCCNPCCVVLRVEVHDCETGLPVEDAAVTVTDADAVVVDSGTTDDTGTLVFLLPEAAGANYTVTAAAGDDEDQVVEFTAHCGVNYLTARMGWNGPLVAEICVVVTDSGTGDPMAGVDVYIDDCLLPAGTSSAVVGPFPTDAAGRVCFPYPFWFDPSPTFPSTFYCAIADVFVGPQRYTGSVAFQVDGCRDVELSVTMNPTLP